ncbi:MAG: DUF4340 domain-containing protein [Lachnospiraceae bacterium]|nr:DUF4340 domain-containing protein [Lachnospiraceae bacterium]
MEEREERALRLKRLKKKRMISVLVLCVVLLGLGGGYFALSRANAKKAAEEAKRQEELEQQANVTEEITTFAMTDVSTIEFSNEENSYVFTWEEEEESMGSWVKQDERDFPTNEEKLQNIIGVFCGMTGTKRIAAADVVQADYGVDDTACVAKLILTDGAEHSFRLGDKAPYDEGYYMLYENTGDVFVVADNVHTQLTTKHIKLVQGETFPSAYPEKITEIRVEIRDGETTTYAPVDNGDGTISFPSIFYDSTRFVASTIQEYNCKDFSKYGLEDPYATVTIDYMGYVFDDGGMLKEAPCTMMAEIGDKTVSGNYFVRIDKSDFVYIMMESHAMKYLPR